MKTEMLLAKWAAETHYRDLPPSVVGAMKLLTRTILGTTVAGATADGCAATVQQVSEWGGRPEATILIYGGKAPAHAAAMANSVIARALDICDGSVPGQHIGTTAIPVGLAMAELEGGLSGEDFITALAVGSEVASRLGFVSRLDGFDPTGVCAQFASAIVAARILELNPKQMMNAMGLAFNRAGGSFQSNIDGSLAVRLIQGFISQNGVICAQLAQRNLTGPNNWLEGVWGYYHLFCKGQANNDLMAGGLGQKWYLLNFGYKTAPSCGATISSTDAILELLRAQPIEPEELERVDIRMAAEGPCNLVGHEFKIGDNPQVDAQFNVRYCVANVILRKSAQLVHFSPEFVTDPRIMSLARKVHTHLEPALAEGRPELAARVVLEVWLKDGRLLSSRVDGPSGFPPRGLTEDQHLQYFRNNVAYGGLPLGNQNVGKILSMTQSLERMADVRDFIPPMVSDAAAKLQAAG